MKLKEFKSLLLKKEYNNYIEEMIKQDGCIKDYIKRENTISQIIMMSFSWNTTKLGSKYWTKIYDKYNKKEI